MSPLLSTRHGTVFISSEICQNPNYRITHSYWRLTGPLIGPLTCACLQYVLNLSIILLTSLRIMNTERRLKSAVRSVRSHIQHVADDAHGDLHIAWSRWVLCGNSDERPRNATHLLLFPCSVRPSPGPDLCTTRSSDIIPALRREATACLVLFLGALKV